MKNIYELAVSVFKSDQSSYSENKQALRDAIEELLSEGNDKELDKAVYFLMQNGKNAAADLVNGQIQHLIEIDVPKNGNGCSDLFLIPFVTKSQDESTSMPSIGFVEKNVVEFLSSSGLTPEGSETVLAPMILGRATSINMRNSQWYSLHRQIATAGDARFSRSVFSNKFSFKSNPGIPELNFFVGTIVQKDSDLSPALFENGNETEEKKIEFSEFLSQSLKTSDSVITRVLPPQTLAEALLNGYQFHQDALTESFAASNAPCSGYLVVPIAVPDNFIAFSYDENSDSVSDFLLFEPFAYDMNTNLSKLAEAVKDSGRELLIGNATLPQMDSKGYMNFDVATYLKEEGAVSYFD